MKKLALALVLVLSVFGSFSGAEQISLTENHVANTIITSTDGSDVPPFQG